MAQADPVTEPLTVALVAALPPPAGGVASWAQDLLRGAISERVRFLTVERSPGTLNHGPLRDGAKRLAASARAARAAVRVLRRERVDVLHVCITGSPIGLLRDQPMIALARQLDVPTVLHVHGSATRVDPARLLGRIAARTLRRVERVVVLNEPSRAHLAGLGVERLHVVPNGVPILEPAAPGTDDDGPLRVLYVGWLKPAKGVLDLLAAAREVPDLHLRLVGRFVDEGGESSEPAIRAAMADPAIAARVELVGEVPREQVFDELRQAQVFALPSHAEGLPIALLEAMMIGVAPIVSSVGGMPEAVIDGRCGLVVPPQDLGALVRALGTYADDRALVREHAAAARARALDAYATPRQHAALESLWRQVATEAGRPSKEHP